MYFRPLILSLADNACIASLKELARRHRDELEKYSKVDVEAVLDITYLNEFDRLIQ